MLPLSFGKEFCSPNPKCSYFLDNRMPSEYNFAMLAPRLVNRNANDRNNDRLVQALGVKQSE